MEMTNKDKALLDEFHIEFKNDTDLQAVVNNYIISHGLYLPDSARYIPGIDCVEIRVENVPVLVVGLPPVSDYPVEETEYTRKYLCSEKGIAV